MDHVCSINSLPEEILIAIFEYLTHNELGHISSVCRKWYTTAKNPILWRKVNIKFHWFNGSQKDIVSKFSEKLCSSVTYIKLVFDYCHWKERLDFLELCVSLKEKCPLLNTLILHRALFTNSFSVVIDACSVYLPNLKALLLPKSVFSDDCKEKEFGGPVKIEILDISACSNIGRSSVCSFSKMLSLKKLNLFGTFETYDRCFWHEDNVSFLHQLEILHLGNSSMCSRTFCLLQKFAINLKELFLCWTDLDDEDFNFSNSVFPLLKIVCLRRCKNLSYEGITSLLQSCVSLEVVYIDRNMSESSVIPSLPLANISKLGIVKVVDNCHHSNIQDYLLH